MNFKIRKPAGTGLHFTLDSATQRPVQLGTCADCHVREFYAASNIAYEPFGGVSSMTYGNGQQITVTHNQQYQVQELQSGSMLDRNYSYDGMGNITEIDRNSMPDDLTPVYPYSYTDDYSYSTQSASSIMQIDNGDMTQTHAYYAHNIIGDVTVTRQYAIHGELTKELHLTWNEDHRLTEVKDGSNTTIATYTYNGLGQRVKKVANSVTTVFLYDLQGNIISEMRDGSYDDYLYLENQRIAKIASSGAIYYYHNDHLGTPIAMTDSSGNVVWKAGYKTFGEAQVDSSSTVTNNFRFPGQYYDEETGLHYNYHRYYDPGTGRYLSADSVGIKKGKNNLYAYVQNNPIKFTDRLGLFMDMPPWLPGEPWPPKINGSCIKCDAKGLSKCLKNGLGDPGTGMACISCGPCIVENMSSGYMAAIAICGQSCAGCIPAIPEMIKCFPKNCGTGKLDACTGECK